MMEQHVILTFLCLIGLHLPTSNSELGKYIIRGDIYRSHVACANSLSFCGVKIIYLSILKDAFIVKCHGYGL